jgi:hypothetical protein
MDDNRKEYITNLQKLDFKTFKAEDQVNASIYLVSDLEEYTAKRDVSPYILIALDKAKTFNADAVYFRFFDDGRPPMAQIYIYDNISNPQPTEYYAQRHREIWSSCEVASFFIIDRSIIKIYDSRKPVKVKDDILNSTPIAAIDLLSDIDDLLLKYKAQNFDNGSFWEDENVKNDFRRYKIASERLIKGLREIKNILHLNNVLNPELIDKLLIICILIKYLEETGIEGDKNYAHDFFEKATGYETLENIIRYNKLNCLLSALANHFNGGIFHIDKTFRQELDNSDISCLVQFFEAGYKNNLFGWKEYSFEHIPVELISNFYEEFIPKADKAKTNEKNKEDTGAVYTPSFVVNLLIDECLPLTDLDENVKLIDPACGSGIFLVTAYKRLVQRWRIKNRTEKLADTNPQKLKEILTNNIFGVDTNPNSVNLSIFSLQLALCSMLTPRQIWTTELQFSDLQKDGNIIHKDFFKYLIEENPARNFDLVIGNPPFVSEGKKLDGKSYEYYTELLQGDFQIKFSNPKKEFALLFLEESMHLLEEKKGKLCLILPSGPLLYMEDSSSVRKQLFAEYNVSQIVDFTFLRRVLFQATIASLAIFVDCAPPTDLPVLHITAKRTKQSKERFYFEFDHYDFYKVPKDLVTGKINVWKCNLLGGYRVCDIIDKLNKIETKLKDFYFNNKVSVKSSNIKKANVFSDCETRINENSLFKEEEFVPQKSNDYWAIRKKITEGVFPTEITMNDFGKNNKIEAIGFKGSVESIKQLKNYVTKYSELICFYIMAVSGRQGIRGPYTIYLSDFNDFPFLDNLNDYLTISDKIIVNDVVKYTLKEFGKGENSLINASYANKNDLIRFSEIYCNILNSVYCSENKRYILTQIIEADACFICEIQYTDKEVSSVALEWTYNTLNNLLFEMNPSQSRKIAKVIRFYRDNAIHIIKPKQLRFWMQSKALRDADETFDDILNF